MTHPARLCLPAALLFGLPSQAQQPDAALRPWLETPQQWQRDTDGPVISLGQNGAFDDTHIFAPMAAFEDGEYRLWYCGSTGTVGKRVFQLGLAAGRDGRRFAKSDRNPVYAFGDGKHSILTPTLLRNPDGSVLREDGRHSLHQTFSRDGFRWTLPSPELLEGVSDRPSGRSVAVRGANESAESRARSERPLSRDDHPATASATNTGGGTPAGRSRRSSTGISRSIRRSGNRQSGDTRHRAGVTATRKPSEWPRCDLEYQLRYAGR